jgi:hypothetical protein
MQEVSLHDRPSADRQYVIMAFLTQIALVVFFAIRTWSLDVAIAIGWIVYALGIPSLAVSVVLMRAGRPFYLSFAGIAYAAWAAFGFVVEYVNSIEWRSPIVWPIFVPYVTLYLLAQMFYWWPLARIDRRLWVAYTALFVMSTALNIVSHG